MPSPTTSSPVSNVASSGELSTDSLLANVKWGGAQGQGVSLTYSFAGTTPGVNVYDANYTPLNEPFASTTAALTEVQQAAAAQALQAWANVANLTFAKVQESSTEVGDIRFNTSDASNTAADGSQAWGWAYYPDGKKAAAGDVWLSNLPAPTANPDWSVGSYHYELLMHELGHALGLKHPFEGSKVLDTAHDSRQYTLMAYQDAAHSLYVDVTRSGNSVTWHSHVVNPDTPMLYDIAAMQYLYGANMSYRTGADTYTFDSSTPFLRTIWDAGGNDTISVANFATNCLIDLQQGHYSSLRIPSDSTAGVNWTTPPPVATYDGTDNLAIAFGAVIENATGGSGSDTLIGNSSANHLQGNGGINALNGGAGIDTAVYSGNFSDYAVSATTGGYSVTLRSSSSQVDSLVDIERLSFKDGSMALGMGSMAEDTLQAQYVALAQKFYVAYFGRPADAGGLANMVAQFAAAKVPTTTDAFANAYYSNAAIKVLIESFGNSAESATLYHGNNDDFVTAIYAHLLGRAPDQEGLDFWSGALDGGNLARGLAALSIMAGAESNTTTQGLADAVLIANRVTVAGNFTALLDTPGEVAGYAGDAAAAAARSMLDAVNQNTSVLAYESSVFSTVSKMSGAVAGAAPEVVLVGIGTAVHDGVLA